MHNYRAQLSVKEGELGIHPTAVIHSTARLGEGCVVGPYVVIGPDVELGPRCRVEAHVRLEGPMQAGEENQFYPFCSIGSRSQDLKYEGEPTYLEIGSGNVFREFVTINRGTKRGGKTVIGHRNNFLAYAHVAHDCRVGSFTIFSNNGTLAGHVEIGDYVIIGGLSAIHQFCRVGAHAMIGGCSKIVQDVPPYFVADGNPTEIRGVNLIGLQRRGFEEDQIKLLRRAFKILYGTSLNTSQALTKISAELQVEGPLQVLLDFVQSSQRGIIR